VTNWALLVNNLPRLINDPLYVPLAAAEDALARLDERLRASPIREGWISRSHYQDACACLWLAGELVRVEDLVLHDARMDVVSPTHALTRAQAVLRARRRIFEAAPEWAMSETGIRALRNDRGVSEAAALRQTGIATGRRDELIDDNGDGETDPLGEELHVMESVLARTNKLIAGEGIQGPAPLRSPILYDAEWNEEEKLSAWRIESAPSLAEPSLLTAAKMWDAWETGAPLERQSWLGNLLVAAALRQREKTRFHLLCVNSALRCVDRQKRRSANPIVRLVTFLDAVKAGSEAGMKDHDRWLLARQQLQRKIAGRRPDSRMPALVDYLLARPLASAKMIAAGIGVAPRTAQDMVAELGLRELTGRMRYRAWGIL
jgi:hypothetical protein